ncbi:hypothetical protein N7476_009130 [Penicillium atrosanguineum]|uniref:Uncharacterized protein n=1 Tax=Penicillium atrosanguineum TaxID=1132637 RepID=A0A9W9PUC6_9EURO|nr:hypothetical protein N7526_002119 [Penicillium atrosanguineum]KAJ5308474.1 hypothetical protein N7476_009130 [Penicillium atrosanguineum]
MAIKTERLLAAILAANPKLRLDYRQIAVMYGEGSTFNSIEYKMRPMRKLSARLIAEEANGDSNVAMSPSPDGPRIRAHKVTKAKPKAKITATQKAKGTKAGEATLTESLIDVDGAAESDADALIVIGEPVKIDSDTENDTIIKVKEEKAFAGEQYTGEVDDKTNWFGISEQGSGFQFDKEIFKHEKFGGDKVGTEDMKSEYAPAWPDKAWFKEEDEA